MLKELAHQLATLRGERKLSRVALSTLTKIDRATIAALETGGGTLASMSVVAKALGHAVRPFSSALSNKRRWQGIGTRSLAADAGISRPTLIAFEGNGQGRVATFERLCRALDEVPVLRPKEATWWTPPDLVRAILSALDIDRFDLDPASPSPPTVPCRAFHTERDGGLWLPWQGVTFVNPPYDDVPRWLAKAVEEYKAGRAACVIALVPYRPETNAWKSMMHSGADVFVLEDRLRFGGRAYISPSVSAAVAWGATSKQVTALHRMLPRHHRIVRVSAAEPWSSTAP